MIPGYAKKHYKPEDIIVSFQLLSNGQYYFQVFFRGSFVDKYADISLKNYNE